MGLRPPYGDAPENLAYVFIDELTKGATYHRRKDDWSATMCGIPDQYRLSPTLLESARDYGKPCRTCYAM